MSKDTQAVDHKAIRAFIKNRIEAEYPAFRRLRRKEKRKLLRDACKAARAAIKAGELSLPALDELERLGLDKIPQGVMSIAEMARFIEDHHGTVLPFPNPSRSKYIKNSLLEHMDALLEDSLLDQILATPAMTPSMRDFMPSQFLRIELLRTALFPQWSVRKFCAYLADLAHKQERAFCHLPLHRLKMCDHSTLRQLAQINCSTGASRRPASAARGGRLLPVNNRRETKLAGMDRRSSCIVYLCLLPKLEKRTICPA